MSDELNKNDISEIDKAIEENKQKLATKKEDNTAKIEADIRAKVLAEMKAKEEANKIKEQNEAMQKQIKELKEAQEKQKEAFEEKISKFSGNGNSQMGNSHQSSNQSVKDKINKMTPEESKAWEEAQKEAAFDLFERRRNGRSN